MDTTVFAKLHNVAREPLAELLDRYRYAKAEADGLAEAILKAARTEIHYHLHDLGISSGDDVVVHWSDGDERAIYEGISTWVWGGGAPDVKLILRYYTKKGKPCKDTNHLAVPPDGCEDLLTKMTDDDLQHFERLRKRKKAKPVTTG